MLKIRPARTYHAVPSGTDIYRGSNGKTALKIYYIDIIGRDEPSRYEWAHCGLDQAEFRARLSACPGMEGIGFIIAFPHVMKVFRFAPESEILLTVRAWQTREMTPMDLARGEGYVEFACLAEAEIAAEEYRFWAAAESVEDYLAQWYAYPGGRISRADKLRSYWV